MMDQTEQASGLLLGVRAVAPNQSTTAAFGWDDGDGVGWDSDGWDGDGWDGWDGDF